MPGADGCAYAIPNKAHQVLRIDPDNENPVMTPFTFWFWGVVAYSPMADEGEYDEWRGRVRHFETRMSEIVDHRSDQTEQRVSEQLTAVDRRVSEIQTDMRELRDQNAELRADIALLLAASRRG